MDIHDQVMMSYLAEVINVWTFCYV